MKKSLLQPEFILKTVLDLSPQQIKSLQYTWLVLDVDNTIVPKGTKLLSDATIAWVNEIKALGIEVMLVSNNFSNVSQILSERLNVLCLKGAMKPFSYRFKTKFYPRLEHQKGLIIGDQIFTDILLGKNLNVDTALVNPLSKQDWLSTRCLRWIEHFIVERPQ